MLGSTFRDYLLIRVGRKVARNRGYSMLKNLNLEEAVNFCKKYYCDNNLETPINVVTYLSSFPPGFSRQALQKAYGIKCSEFVSKLTDNLYAKPLNAAQRAKIEAHRLGYTLLSSEEYLSTATNRSKVKVSCNICYFEHETTISSLSGSKLGCPKCKSKNLPWRSREVELKDFLLDRYNCTLVSNIPTNESGAIELQHLDCGSKYSITLVKAIHPSSPNEGTCPNCRTTDRRVVHGGITFGSTFEYECYRIIEHIPNLEVHVPYSKYIDTDRRWVCDFKIGNYWLEVSNFKQDYKGYFNNISDKEELVTSSGQHFFFIRSLEEMQELSSIL